MSYAIFKIIKSESINPRYDRRNGTWQIHTLPTLSTHFRESKIDIVGYLAPHRFPTTCLREVYSKKEIIELIKDYSFYLKKEMKSAKLAIERIENYKRDKSLFREKAKGEGK